MQLSEHNIVSRIKDSDSYFIVNQLSGNADILEPHIGRDLLVGKVSDEQAFIDKGYLVDKIAEAELFKSKYQEFKVRSDSDEIQVFFVPWYTCNFNCSYCYQNEYENQNAPLTKEIIDAFFNRIEEQFKGRNYYITFFGGEPLRSDAPSKALVEYFFSTATQKNISIAIVTNGYSLEEYVPVVSKATIREVQVTLDGPRNIHNARRPRKNSSEGTFDQIVKGIDAALAAHLKINLRVVLDKENIDSLPLLAAFAKEKGWIENPLFKTQFGRNYELHHCSASPDKLFTRIALYEKIYALAKDNPLIYEFHKPAYSISRFLSENGALPDPLFDACPGCKTEWAFDYTGHIYSCTATVGKTDESLGTFYPNITIDNDQILAWKKRDITTITACQSCSSRLACGGGCASVAKNQHGSLLSPDCRPVKELIGLGINAYFTSKEEAT